MVKIEFEKIQEVTETSFVRYVHIKDIDGFKLDRMLVAETREELEIIDHENMPEEKYFSFLNGGYTSEDFNYKGK